MNELYFSLPVHLVGYLIALAVMITFYASERLSVSVQTTTRWLVPARSTVRRK
jgi:hypothetical protein